MRGSGTRPGRGGRRRAVPAHTKAAPARPRRSAGPAGRAGPGRSRRTAASRRGRAEPPAGPARTYPAARSRERSPPGRRDAIMPGRRAGALPGPLPPRPGTAQAAPGDSPARRGAGGREVVTGWRAVTGGRRAAPPRRDRERERDGCAGLASGGRSRPAPLTGTLAHTLTHTHTPPARPGILPKFPPPPPLRRVPLGALRPPPESGPGTARPGPARHNTARHGTARPGTAAVCPDPQPDPRPGESPLPHPHGGLNGVSAPAPAAGLRGQRRMLSDLELEPIADRTGLCPAACHRCFTPGHPPAHGYCCTPSSSMPINTLQCVRLLVQSEPQQ
ncbi:basic proline-rich protein-like [Prinia subflava]|uniref:basic proline-rich protein-like n=1 Tax=Prinia subflava TaxID=208062 RepID=UPI002FE36700